MFDVGIRYGFAIQQPKAILSLPTVIEEPIYSYTYQISIPQYIGWDWSMKLRVFIFGEMSLISCKIIDKKIVGYK